MKRLLFLFAALIAFAAGPPKHAPTAYFDGRTRCGNTGAATYALASFAAAGTLQMSFGTDTINWCPAMVQTGVTLRDPRVIKYLGTYYIAYTTGGITNWGLISSSDLISWSTTTNISVTGGGLVPSNTWAPSWFTDTDGSIHIVVAIATTAQTNFQIYEQHPTTSSLTGTWTNPALMTVTGQTTLIDPFVVCIDQNFNLCTASSVGNSYKLFYTICCGTQEFGQYAAATTLTGTYTNAQTGNWAGWLTSGTDVIEGMQLMPIAGGWRIFFDYLSSGSLTAGQLYYSDSTNNWVTWSGKKPLATAPNQAKHGTVLAYP